MVGSAFYFIEKVFFWDTLMHTFFWYLGYSSSERRSACSNPKRLVAICSKNFFPDLIKTNRNKKKPGLPNIQTSFKNKMIRMIDAYIDFQSDFVISQLLGPGTTAKGTIYQAIQ